MKELKLFLLLVVLSFTGYLPVRADLYSKNLGFESGNFTGWTGYTWIYRTDYPSFSTSKQLGIVSGRHTIMTDTLAYDSYTGGKLKKVPKGYRYSARLGQAVTGGQEESLSYTFKIDSTNALLVWKFAVVLQDPLSGHTRTEEPRFKVTLLNQKGDTIPDCANYDVYASDASIKGFQTYPLNSSSSIMWRDWTTVGANLLPYIGQTVTIEFMAADCTHQGHFGYAYFVAESHPMFITVKYCTGDSSAKLTGPEGFDSYSWKDSNGNTIASKQILDITNPVEGATYSCQMTSATGCSVTLTSTIAKYEPNADFKEELVDCNNLTNTMHFTNLHPATHGTLEYKWYFEDGTTSTLKSPTHTFTTSGMHPVSLVVDNPPSLCSDSVSRLVETFYPPLVGITGDSVYCEGTTTTLKGHGAFRYVWSNGSTADSIMVGKDTTVWMIGYSSVGCYTDTIRYKVHKAPDWPFSVDGNLFFCKGGSTTLQATGAKSYHWSTGANTAAITISKAGDYTITGTNSQGCQKNITCHVWEDPLPNVDFTVAPSVVNTRHNKVTCTAAAQAGVNYSWNMGDGNTETGSTIIHAYDVANNLYEYKITLTATNANGCVNVGSKTVDIAPFIPNVFSPNNDGVNEVFMAGLQMQIFDRNGLKIYDGKTGWDGRYNGKVMDNDTYFYLINYTDKNKVEKTIKGFVTLKK
ncbi:MAG: PKD domain-containing protein [Paludibacter sp.]|nr:PKD domain-containing protein [Paludibacter sp.]